MNRAKFLLVPLGFGSIFCLWRPLKELYDQYSFQKKYPGLVLPRENTINAMIQTLEQAKAIKKQKLANEFTQLLPRFKREFMSSVNSNNSACMDKFWIDYGDEIKSLGYIVDIKYYNAGEHSWDEMTVRLP